VRVRTYVSVWCLYVYVWFMVVVVVVVVVVVDDDAAIVVVCMRACVCMRMFVLYVCMGMFGLRMCKRPLQSSHPLISRFEPGCRRRFQTATPSLRN